MKVKAELVRIAQENPKLRSIIIPVVKSNDVQKMIHLAKAILAEEEAKAEELKAEELKAEEPKAEEPKAEEPKAKEPKAEKKASENTLRKQIIRLASERPELREVLIPLLKANK